MILVFDQNGATVSGNHGDNDDRPVLLASPEWQ